jgi:hypothetical protein
LREAYAFCGVPSDWVDITYQSAFAAKKYDARIGPCDDWDVQAPNIRRRFIEESERRQGKRALDLTDKLFERIEGALDGPGFQVKGSVATEIHTSVKTARLLADKPTEITGMGDVVAWWNGLTPQQQRDELSKLGVDVSQFDEPEADRPESGLGGDSEGSES